jgi:hypothetical protein
MRTLIFAFQSPTKEDESHQLDQQQQCNNDVQQQLGFFADDDALEVVYQSLDQKHQRQQSQECNKVSGIPPYCGYHAAKVRATWFQGDQKQSSLGSIVQMIPLRAFQAPYEEDVRNIQPCFLLSGQIKDNSNKVPDSRYYAYSTMCESHTHEAQHLKRILLPMEFF